MITDDRPLKTMKYVRPSWGSPKYSMDDAFDLHTKETIDLEYFYLDGDEKFRVVESCAATWFEKDGTFELDAMTGLNTWERLREVQCLEPATWYVNIPVAAAERTAAFINRG